MESLPESLGVFFSNDIDVKICIDSLLDDFEGNYILFLFFSSLDGGGRLGLQAIYDVITLFFFKHGLNKISSLEPVFEIPKLFSFFTIVVFSGYLE